MISIYEPNTDYRHDRKSYLIQWDIKRAYYISQIKDVKHSPNIIELIEVGDYVNGSKVIKTNCKLEYIDDDSDTGVNEVDNGLEIAGYPTWIYFGCEIKSIVTKEQFDSIKYEV